MSEHVFTPGMQVVLRWGGATSSARIGRETVRTVGKRHITLVDSIHRFDLTGRLVGRDQWTQCQLLPVASDDGQAVLAACARKDRVYATVMAAERYVVNPSISALAALRLALDTLEPGDLP